MKYKAGDKVVIKDWNVLKDCYSCNDNYITGGKGSHYIVNEDKRKYCGKTVTITGIADDAYVILEDNGEWFWEDWMIERKIDDSNSITKCEFKPGEEILVSEDGKDWCKRIFISYLEGHNVYVTVSETDINNFYNSSCFEVIKWQYAKHLKKKEIVINGKSYNVDEETYKKIIEMIENE